MSFAQQYSEISQSIMERRFAVHTHEYPDVTVIARGKTGTVLRIDGSTAMKITEVSEHDRNTDDLMTPMTLGDMISELALFKCLSDEGIAPSLTMEPYVIFTLGKSSVGLDMRGVRVELATAHPVLVEGLLATTLNITRPPVKGLPRITPTDYIDSVDIRSTMSPCVQILGPDRDTLVVHEVVRSHSSDRYVLDKEEKAALDPQKARSGFNRGLSSQVIARSRVPKDAITYRGVLCMERYAGELDNSRLDDISESMAQSIKADIEGLVTRMIDLGVVCTDVNPHNVMLKNRGDGKVDVRLIDFGVHCNVDDIGMPTDFLRGMILAMLAITTEFRRLRSWVADFVALRSYKKHIRRFQKSHHSMVFKHWTESQDVEKVVRAYLKR